MPEFENLTDVDTIIKLLVLNNIGKGPHYGFQHIEDDDSLMDMSIEEVQLFFAKGAKYVPISVLKSSFEQFPEIYLIPELRKTLIEEE
jgi:hypothetical protein